MVSFRKLNLQVKHCISENDTSASIQLLREALRGHPLENSLLLRASQQFGLQREIWEGTFSWEQTQITQNQINNALLEVAKQLAEEEIRKTKVFISYNRASNSTNFAYALRQQLKGNGFQVFLDVEDIPVGADWAITLWHEIETCDYFVLLLSKAANSSEMVIKEVEIAHDLKSERNKPQIIPIRIDFPMELKLNHRLHSRLNRIHQLEWKNETDTQPILARIMDVLHHRQELPAIGTLAEEKVQEFLVPQNAPPSPVAPLEVPRGAVRLDSKYYVERDQEKHFIQCLDHPGALLRIRGPRQFGKTSLLTRVMAQADQQDYHIVAIDFQEIDKNTLADLDKLLWELCYYFAEELDAEDELERRWSRPRAKKQICTAFLEKDILNRIDQPVLLALDEADRLFSYPDVSSDFFLLLRSWHEKSKVPNKKVWEKFRLALSYSTEAKLAIQDLNASPFNVGEEAKLYRFTEAQVADLADRHGLSWNTDQLRQIMELLSGQPYLVRRSMYLLAKGEYTFDALLEQAAQQNGPFSDHLRHHLVNVKQFADCIEAMQDIVHRGKCKDPLIATRLEATGLVTGTHPNITTACKLYADYFKGKL